MKIPSNVVRCVECDGPIKHEHAKPYECSECGRHLLASDETYAVLGAQWEIVGGWLLSVETEDDPRDTEEEVSDLYAAFDTLASVFGDGLTAAHIGPSLTCGEANAIAEALVIGGQKDAAITFLEAHGKGDDDEDDAHGGESFDAYEYLFVKPEPVGPPLETVTVDELVELIGL